MWSGLSAATRRQRDNIFLHVLETGGGQPFAKITAKHIADGRERRAGTPAQARNFLDAMRALFKWAAAAEHVKTDPTLGVENPPRKAGGGFLPWTEDHVTAYERRWPIGSRQRVWVDLLLYTGLRRGDAVRFGRQHVRDGLVPRHNDFDWLGPGQSSSGRHRGSTSSSMLRAVLGLRLMTPARSSVSTIW
jgi:site-specific recombinase XerD